MYLLIIMLPLLGSLIAGFGGRVLGCYGTCIISIFCVFLTMIICALAFFEIAYNGLSVYLEISPWIYSEMFEVSWTLLFDTLTAVMLIIITSISSLVHFYSVSYMEQDPHLPRFMSYLEIFTFFMLILVTADNFLQMFLGWEGVGLASYLLINFWFTRLAANQSALKALIVNRVGDFGLLLAILVIFYTFNTVDYSIIFNISPLVINYNLVIFNYPISIVTIIGFFIFIGAIGKSAQLGLHTWLPDAMEGPTPVSALIHAATMVTAGIFLIIRCSPLFEFSDTILIIFVIVGSLTAFFASMTGLFQNDLKRVIAYSTCSQLGYMLFACGISCYNISMFHLTNHAFFKALLFLGAGSVIHAISDEQDMRRMGSLISFLPVTYSLILIGSLALIGMPFLTGFYSKDFLLEVTHIFKLKNTNINEITCWLGNLSVFFTAFYSFRLIYLTFINNINNNRISVNNIKESSNVILIPLVILGIGSLFVGYLLKDSFIGLGTDFWQNSIFIFSYNMYYIEAEYIKLTEKWLPFFCSIGAFSLVYMIQTNKLRFYNIQYIKWISFIVSKKWYWDFFYNKFFVYPILNLGYSVTFKNLDRGFIELLGPYGVINFINNFGLLIKKLQTGYITHYIFVIIFGVSLNIINLELHLFKNALFNIYWVLIFFI